MESSELMRSGRLAEALKSVQEQVRKEPANDKHRVFLFQLLCVMGDWERAMTQLNVATELDASNLLMAHLYRPALNCEALRAEIFAGRRGPLVFGEPDEWVGWIVQANQMAAGGQYRASQELRERAFEAAPGIPGTINGQAFEWIADMDSRLGPILEAVVDGRYYWVPFPRIRRVIVEKPADLRDLVWSCAHFTWTNGGEAFGLIPTRYPGSEAAEDSGIRLARRTEWKELEGQFYVGLGQRMLTTDQGEYPLLETRTITLDHGDEGQAEAGPGDASAQEPKDA